MYMRNCTISHISIRRCSFKGVASCRCCVSSRISQAHGTALSPQSAAEYLTALPQSDSATITSGKDDARAGEGKGKPAGTEHLLGEGSAGLEDKDEQQEENDASQLIRTVNYPH